MRFSKYTGDNRAWPTGDRSMAETSFSLPVYRNYPERPYEVIGSVRFEDPRKYWDDGVIADAVSVAKRKQADAIIIRQGAELGVGLTSSSMEDPQSWSASQTTALIIKWKSKFVLDDESAALEDFRSKFKSEYPGLVPSDSAFILARQYLQSLNMTLGEAATTSRLHDILSETQNRKPGSLSGKWFYKCTIRKSSITTSFSDILYGLASVTQEGNSVTILSVGGKVELNANGTLEKGRFTGKMGIGTIASAGCEGAAVAEKISLSSQSQTADGTFQGSLVLER